MGLLLNTMTTLIPAGTQRSDQYRSYGRRRPSRGLPFGASSTPEPISTGRLASLSRLSALCASIGGKHARGLA